MKITIPFVSRFNEEEERIWLTELSLKMPGESILPFSKLTATEKQNAEIAIVANPDPKDLAQLPNLIWVHSVWAGVERMVRELGSPKYSIVRLVDKELTNTMVEAVMAWTLFLHRDMPAYALQQAQALWQPLPSVPARARTVAVLGLGELGANSAKRLSEFGFSVLGWSRTEKSIDGVTTYFGEDGLEAILKKSDIVVCLLPLTSTTEGLLNFDTLALLKPGAQLINFARGPIVDEEALQYNLNTGHLKHAVLDVFAIEPLPRSHPFWTHPRVTVLPHIAATTSPFSASRIVAQNIRNYRHLNILPDTVDLQAGY